MDVNRLLVDICQALDPVKRNRLRTLVQELTARKAAREIPSVTKALVERAPAVVGADLWHACCEMQRREVPGPPDHPAAAVRGERVGVAREGRPQPRGRPPKGALWDAARGEWIRAGTGGEDASPPDSSSDDPWRCDWCGTRPRRRSHKGPGTLCGPCGYRFSRGKTGPLSATFECRWCGCDATSTRCRYDGPTGEDELCQSCGWYYGRMAPKAKARLVHLETELDRLTSVPVFDVDAGTETRAPPPKRGRDDDAAPASSLKREKVQRDAFVEIKREKEALEDRVLCTICMEADAPRTVLFGPCNHFLACASCADALQECPNCRVPITARTSIANTS